MLSKVKIQVFTGLELIGGKAVENFINDFLTLHPYSSRIYSIITVGDKVLVTMQYQEQEKREDYVADPDRYSGKSRRCLCGDSECNGVHNK